MLPAGTKVVIEVTN